MAVLNQRPSSKRRPFGRRAPSYRLPPPRRRRSGRIVAVLLLALVAALGAGAALLVTSRAKLVSDPAALARVSLPLGGGRVESVSVVTGPHSQPVPISGAGDRVWPSGKIPAGQLVTIDVTVKRPGWLSWLTGSREHLQLTERTPSASLAAQYVTLARGAPLSARFSSPVSVVWYGAAQAHLHRLRLAGPRTDVALPHRAGAGSLWVAGAPRAWETAAPALMTWFPAGASASAVASPAPGTVISPTTPISLTFSKPIAQALGRSRPPVSPVTAGTWQQLNSHTIVFRPQGTGYGLGAHVTVALPAGVRLIPGAHTGAGSVGRWRVPPGSTRRLQQLLAQLGYLPLSFTPSGPAPASTPVAQEVAAIHPPAGTFAWRYQNAPAALRAMWAPGASGEMTRGAVMMFENSHGLAPDGVAGPLVWKALVGAVLGNQRSTFGYTFVDVNVAGQRLMVWHDGRTILTTPVNTGIAQAPTAKGTYAVYEHLRVTTMSGTNPDGSHYHDPGIQFVSYFNGGDALHAFTRAQYGFPQSLGCVEMPLGPAGQVWPYTPIGTIVHVA